MGKTDRQQMGPLYCSKKFQDPIQVDSSLIVSSNTTESIFLTVTSRKDRYPSPEMGSGKGTRSGNSRYLFPDIRCSKNRKLRPVIEFSLLNRYIKKHSFKMETVVSKTVDCEQRLGCLHRLDRCLPSRSDTSSIQKVSDSSTKIRYSNSRP